MRTTIELTIRRHSDIHLTAELRAELARKPVPLGKATILINQEDLRAKKNSPDAYGAALTAMVLPVPLHAPWQRARGYAERTGEGFHLRVMLDEVGSELHSLRWELLRDPLSGIALAQQESDSFARLITVDDLHDEALHTRPSLQALVAVAGPVDANLWNLALVDAEGEARRALAALGEINTNVLAEGYEHSRGLATLANLRRGMRGAHILCLTCHGRVTEEGTTLYLVDDAGKTAPISGHKLANEIRALASAQRPLLAILVACEGARQANKPLAAVGPLLAQAGIPAVVAMQARISIPAAAKFTEQLLYELRRDGRIDRAVAAARKEMGSEWWIPVLWLSLRDGRLWEGNEHIIERSQQDISLLELTAFKGETLINEYNNAVESIQFTTLITDVNKSLRERYTRALFIGQKHDPRRGVCTLPKDINDHYWCSWLEDDVYPIASGALHVHLQKFCLGRYPVTVWQYRQFINAGGYENEDWWTKKGRLLRKKLWPPAHWNNPDWTVENKPVTGVSWYEATAFCAWLKACGLADGWLPGGWTIRLPTEAEWEVAAMWDSSTRKMKLWQPKSGELWQNVKETEFCCTTPVGLFPQGSSPSGALDMAGNVWEWCSSPYEGYPGTASKLYTDNEPLQISLPLRGGSCLSENKKSGWGARDVNLPDLRSYARGFRIALCLNTQ